MKQLLGQWSDWLAGRTDTMLSLEDRARLAGTDDDRADLAAAFVARKAVADRLSAITDLAGTDVGAAAALADQPLVDDLGGAIAANLAEAGTLVDAIVRRVELRVTTLERQSVGEVTAAANAAADLTVAEALAARLGSDVNRAAQLRADLVTRRNVADVAVGAAALRRELEALDADRARLLQAWAGVEARLATLRTDEAAVRQLAQRCRDKVKDAPAIGIPSVDAIGELAPEPALRSMAWPAARALISPTIEKVDRLEAAFAEARRRFQQPLDERDDLRGLLQSFRDKAAAHGLGEHPELEPLYRQAQSLLWTAPCDVDAARGLVQQYVARVNDKVGEVTPS
jgi:hypothetical protein